MNSNQIFPEVAEFKVGDKVEVFFTDIGYEVTEECDPKRDEAHHGQPAEVIDHVWKTQRDGYKVRFDDGYTTYAYPDEVREFKEIVCADHGLSCDQEGHVCELREVWLSRQDLCGECGIREGTIKWGESIQVARGHYTLRCELCAVRAQVKHAEEKVIGLPELRMKLEKLERIDESRI